METLHAMRKLFGHLTSEMRRKFKRRVSFGDLISDRWDNAARCGFGEGTSCYDNVLILGDVKVGKHTWIGPNVVLDGSGGLEIGDYCTIGAGSQIYSHDSVRWANSFGKEPYDRAPTKIGSGVFVGPNVVIGKGVTVGDQAVIGAGSFVNSNIPAKAKAFGSPAEWRGASTPALAD